MSDPTTSTTRVSLTRRVTASPATVFALITDPRMHVRIDGSGMLVSADDDAARLTAVGDTFDMNMDREPLGDIPLGRYRVRNTVTKLVPDTVLEWNVGAPDQPPFGHVYGYELAAIGPDETEVTLYCDWTDVRAGSIRDRFPIVPVTMLERSMDNLARLATATT